MSEQILDQQENKYPSPSAARTVLVLKELAISPRTLGELSEKLQIPKSTVHGIVTTLNMMGWVTYDQANRLILGENIFEVGLLYSRSQRLMAVFQDVSKHLVSQWGETIFLGALENTNVIHLSRADGTETLRFVAEVGEIFPAHRSALGKVLLADMAFDEVNKMYASFNFDTGTNASIKTMAQMQNALHEVKRMQYALDYEEAHPDIHCVAAPVRDRNGDVIASIALAAPVSRFVRNSTEYIQSIVFAAKKISFMLGYEKVDQYTVGEMKQ